MPVISNALRRHRRRAVLNAVRQGYPVPDVAAVYDLTPQAVYTYCRKAGVKAPRTPRGPKPKDPGDWVPPDWAQDVDWDLPDSEIARQASVSRERVRQIRAKLGKPPSRWPRVQLNDEWYAKLNKKPGLTLDEALDYLGVEKLGNSPTQLRLAMERRGYKFAARKPVKPYSRSSRPIENMNWQLPNRDLAAIWWRGIPSGSYNVANVRQKRPDLPKPAWDARFPAHMEQKSYKKALAAEKRKAKRHFANLEVKR